MSDGDLEVVHFIVYGCETWPCTLREEHRRKAFGNRVLRRIFGHKRDEIRGEWNRLYNEELYCPPNIIQVIIIIIIIIIIMFMKV